ncbi:MAG: hypothetical protein JWQ96_2981 [Segetibacter sp.]|nr:hypothetical protein [Segetibacter sp.]
MKEDKVKGYTPQNHGPESDLKKLIRRHLNDPDHVITEDDIRNIELGSNVELSDDADLASKR